MSLGLPPWSLLAAGHAVVPYISSAPTRWQCFCECAGSPDAAIIELLRGQLDRCGPENLAPPTSRCSCWSPSAILFLLFACGCTCLLLGYALAVWRLKRFDGKD